VEGKPKCLSSEIEAQNNLHFLMGTTVVPTEKGRCVHACGQGRRYRKRGGRCVGHRKPWRKTRQILLGAKLKRPWLSIGKKKQSRVGWVVEEGRQSNLHKTLHGRSSTKVAPPM